MNATRQTAILVAGLAGGLVLMALAYSAEEAGPFGRWTAAVCAGIAIVATGMGYWFQRAEIDLEKAGDGCYYQGLLFTLVSLIVVLSDFGAENGLNAAERTNEVVSKFGVALVSTGVGVLVRVVLQTAAGEDNLMPEEYTPERARALYGRELNVAARHTLRALRDAESSFARLGRTTLVHAEAMEGRVREAGGKAGERVEKALEAMASHAETAAQAMEQMRISTLAQASEIRAIAGEGVKRVETMERSARRSEEAVASAVDAAGKLAESAEAARETTEALTAAYDKGKRGSAGATAARKAAEKLETATERAAETATRVEATYERVRRELDEEMMGRLMGEAEEEQETGRKREPKSEAETPRASRRRSAGPEIG